MLLYFLLFIIVFLLNLAAKKSGKEYGLILSFLFLAVFVGISDMLGGYDRYIYSELFDNIADITKGHGIYDEALIFKLFPKELGYINLNILISYITSNRYFFILTITFVIYIFYYISFKRYCNNYTFALLVFMGFFFFFTFTYLRQMIGVGIAWIGIKYVYKRNFFKFIFCILLAASFHNSAIILLPLYFIPIKKFNPKFIITFMIMCLLLGLSGGPSSLFRIYGGVMDMQVRTDNYIERDIGFRYEYIIEAIFFLFFILKNYFIIPVDKKSIVLLNASLGFCAILLLFVLSLNGGRLGWYYLIGPIATISTICSDSHNTKVEKIIIPIVCFILFTRIVFQWGNMLSPYKTFLTNGVRDNDLIYELYEYDHNYATNKFYRR